ncbi:unnamed protein product [Chironomus riparius]|uniref:Uncharacterized protein n=1 Tax=Chironomus riparius TaxID=315576 RepID=A0A9N9RM41_9DIPT|nr:unnamed protein product [Chironomus riparius]
MKNLILCLIMIAIVHAYPIEEQPSENRDDLSRIFENIPEDMITDDSFYKINEIINEIKSKFPTNVIDVPTFCPPGTKLHGGICRPVF